MFKAAMFRKSTTSAAAARAADVSTDTAAAAAALPTTPRYAVTSFIYQVRNKLSF